MLQANLSPTNPKTMQDHNCMQQALVAEGFCTIPKEHAREEQEENKVRRRYTVLGGQWPRSSIQVLLNGPRTAQAVPLFHGHLFH